MTQMSGYCCRQRWEGRREKFDKDGKAQRTSRRGGRRAGCWEGEGVARCVDRKARAGISVIHQSYRPVYSLRLIHLEPHSTALAQCYNRHALPYTPQYLSQPLSSFCHALSLLCFLLKILKERSLFFLPLYTLSDFSSSYRNSCFLFIPGEISNCRVNMNRTDNASLSETISVEGGPADCDWLRQKFVSLYPINVWKSDGFFDDADLMDINCHWLQFEPTRPATHLFLAAIYVVVFAVGCVSNVIVIYILLRYYFFIIN